MKLVSYERGFGRVEGESVVPMGPDLGAYLESGKARDGAPVPLSSVRLLAPVPRPGKIICIGRNYAEHAAESGATVTEEPILFAKFANSLVPHGATVVVPEVIELPDWEAELGVVIGRRASRVTRAEALEYVAGYTCMNDLSARDLQRRVSQWTRGKAIDGFLPAGPWLVTPDEVGDPQTLRISCSLNGVIMQDSTTDLMIFPVDELIAFISTTITLEPGDYIATGTPAGAGFAQDPPRYLRDGDVLETEIEHIGRLETRISAPHLP